MDEKNNLPENQNNAQVNESTANIPAIKPTMSKLPIIIGCAIAVVAIVVAVIIGNGHKAHTEPVISVIDGYVAVNGVKTEHKAHTEPVISVIDGYVAVNGVKTEHKVDVECSHDWETVTIPPTCTEDGYDIMTCAICEKSVRTNVVTGAHEFTNTYITDSSYHWYECNNCNAVKNKDHHTVDDKGICSVCYVPISSTPGVIYDISDDGTYAFVVAYSGTATKIKIADTYQGLPVTTIYDSAFEGNKTITSVIIPDSVTSIGDRAFYYCSSLTSVVIGDSVTSIGDDAFYGCSSLTSVVISDSVTYIGYQAFSGCSSLTSIVIGDSVTFIGGGAFSYCTSLTSVVIGDSVTYIGTSAFSGCSRLTSVAIGDSVTYIGTSAFDGCDKLQYNEYENGKYLGSDDNPYFILIELSTKNLSTYTIHPDTKFIADNVFASCERLTSVVIPDSVTSIGDHAFYGCWELKDVYYTGSEEAWKAITIGSNNSNLSNATIHYNYVPEN